MRALITGSAGLIGSEAALFFAEKGFDIVGVDNDMRSYFFGKEASTEWNRDKLKERLKERYTHVHADIRDESAIANLFKKEGPFDIIIHTAAQPSHDWAAREPYTDFGVNAQGTLIMLENMRKYSPDAVFIFTSTNKVYGNLPNSLPLIELKSRWELPPDHPFYDGIDERMSIDQSIHSVFGASKVAADVMVQEYGRYFGLKTAVFRGGCLTGPAHSSAELHGFMAYLIRCIHAEKKYTIFGYKGKQVRDNIHSYDLVNAFWHFYQKPRPGEVYNMGGARHSNISILEAIEQSERLLNKKARIEISDAPRIGDHIWYVSNVNKFKRHYPNWNFTYNISAILKEMCEAMRG